MRGTSGFAVISRRLCASPTLVHDFFTALYLQRRLFEIEWIDVPCHWHDSLAAIHRQRALARDGESCTMVEPN